MHPEDPDTGTGNPPPWLRRGHAQSRRRARDGADLPLTTTTGGAATTGANNKTKQGLKFDHIFNAHLFNLHEATLLRHSQDVKRTPRSGAADDDDDDDDVTADVSDNLPQLSGRGEPPKSSSVWRTLPMPSERENETLRPLNLCKRLMYV